LEVVKLPEAKRGFVLLPRRWVVERSFAGAIRFRRLVKDYERYASTLADLHLVASPASCSGRPLNRPQVHNNL
jgi:transposase